MRFGSLFSGIGGIDLGLERAGMEVAWQCEIDPYCRKVLAKHWPNVPCYEDVRNLPDDIERVDLICGGYPCQPFSLAGTRGGTDDPRHLWPAFADTIRLLRPRYALLENVPGHLSLGFDGVLADLAALGYDTEWTCIPAAAVGAPHLRWRLFVVAHANEHSEPGQSLDAFTGPRIVVSDAGRSRRREDAGGPYGDESSDARWTEEDDYLAGRLREDVAYAKSDAGRFSDRDGEADVRHADSSGQPNAQGSATLTECPGWRTADGPGWWDVEPDVGRVAHGVSSRVDRLRSLGNAVVPQVAEFVGRRILAHIQRSEAARG